MKVYISIGGILFRSLEPKLAQTISWSTLHDTGDKEKISKILSHRNTRTSYRSETVTQLASRSILAAVQMHILVLELLFIKMTPVFHRGLTFTSRSSKLKKNTYQIQNFIILYSQVRVQF